VALKVNLLPDGLKNWYLKLITPVVNFFIAHKLNPNHFTTVGFILSLVTAYVFATGSIPFAGALVLLAGTFDIIDGRVARATNRVTKFGALYDSTLDRYSEVIVFFGIAYHFVDHGFLWRSVAVSMALGGSLMVSYIRARAEGLNFECKVGIMQRPERIVLLGLGAIATLFYEYALDVAIWVIAIFANFTAIQRLYHVWAVENGRKHLPLETARK
jgi:CDP-diacylglycerol--glycerol-3-phosphate 3-phosphatidyltransferase